MGIGHARRATRKERAAVAVRVFIVDDHLLFRTGLHALLEDGVEAVGEAGDAEHALEQIVRLRPDVVLMDVSLPGMSGVEATRRLTALAPGVRILVLTVAADDQTVRPRRRLRLPTQGHPD
jgi:DNA-binding NarL/FixJ family response regulator